MRQEQDFPTSEFLGEERKEEKSAKNGGVFYEEHRGGRGEDYCQAENIAWTVSSV